MLYAQAASADSQADFSTAVENKATKTACDETECCRPEQPAARRQCRVSSADLYQKLLTYRKVKLKRCRAHKMYDGQVQVQCCFTSTETVRTIRDPESRTATSTFTQLFSSDPPQSSSILVRSFLAVGSYLMPQCRARPGHRDSSLYFCLGPPVRSPCLPVSSQTSSTAAAWPVRTDTEDFRKGLCKLQALVYDILQSLQTPGTGLRHSFSKVEEGAGNRCWECGVFADMSVLCSSSWAFQVFGLPVLISPRTSISVLFWEWSTGTQVVRTLAWPGCQ